MAGPSKFTQFGYRTGHVDLIDWDLGVTKKTGALLDEEQSEWYLPLNFNVNDPARGPVAINRALVVYKRPEPTQVKHEVPQIAIIRDDIDPDEKRIFSPTVQYRLPCEGSTPVSVYGCIGYTSYETKNQEHPYLLTYTIECWARYRTIAQILLQKMMVAFPLRGTLSVLGTEEAGRNVENDRTYLFFQEGIADLTEVNSMVERIPGYSLTIRVEAELTLDRIPTCEPAFTGPTSPNPTPGLPGMPNPDGPGNPDYPNGNPDLPPGGLYGTGAPAVRTTFLED
ncbi:MAG: hypothetical protein R3268_01565 [Acidiferrobacterales bacterium]|nr:hypothetical protein [Acidiferrobacterales bacterium]